MDIYVDGSSLDVGQNVIQQASAVAEKQGEQQTAHHGQQSDAHAVQRRDSAPEDPEDDDEPSLALDGETEDCDDLDDDGLDHDLVRQEAWAICRVRELAKACARLSGPLLPAAVERAARRIARYANRIGGFPPEPEPLTPVEVAALQAALQEVAAATAFPHAGQPTAEGVAAVEQLAQQALEGIDLAAPPPPPPPADGGAGPGASPWPGGAASAEEGGGGEEGISVELLVRAGSERVGALSWGLSCLLRRALSPRNVFGVLLLGRCVGCPELAEAGLLAAIANFPAAVAADKRHFLLLDDSSLLLITSNSHLQVTQELDVWEAIAEWVQHAWESRRGHLYDLLQAGVRLSHLDTLQLSQLQRHPLLLGGEPGPASQLVGAAYSARILGNVHRSRNRQRGAAAAAGAGAAAGGYPAQSTAQPGQQQQQQQQGQGQGGSHPGPRPTAQGQQPQLPAGLPQQRPQPHTALQQLIGSLQARAAAAKAKQQQQQQQLQQQQQRQAAAMAAAAREGPSAPAPRSPAHHAEEERTGAGPAAAAAGSGASVAELRQQLGSGPSSSSRGGTLPTADAGATTHGGVGNTRFATPVPVQVPGSPEAPGGLAGQQQYRRPSPGPLPMTSSPPGPAGEAGAAAGGGGGSGSADKRQLASMLAQAIARAAAKQGLPRIQLGAGGQAVTPSAVQAALSAAQAQLASSPELQEMLREAKAQMAQATQQQQQQQREQPHHHHHQTPSAPCRQEQQQQQQGAHSPAQLPRPPPLAVPASEPRPGPAPTAHAPPSSSSAALPASSPSSSISPALAISPGLASQLLLPGAQPQPQPGQQEAGRPPPPPPTALAPQQLLQIAAAVQKAVRSGQPQPPHVRQQLQQLQAFISRQLAATPAGSQQQPLLLALQSMLAGAASSSPTAQQQQHGQPQQQQGGAMVDESPVQGSPQQEQPQPQGELRPPAAEPCVSAAGPPDPQHAQSHGQQQQPQQQQQEGGSTGQGQDVAQGRGGEGDEARGAAVASDAMTSGIGPPSAAGGGTEGDGGRGDGGAQEGGGGGGEPDPKRRRRQR